MFRNVGRGIFNAVTFIQDDIAPLPLREVVCNVIQFSNVTANEAVGCDDQTRLLKRAAYLREVNVKRCYDEEVHR